MKKVLRFSFLHLSFFIGALILDNLWAFLLLSFLSGLVPKLRINFFYYLGLSLLALIVALFMQPIPIELSRRVDDILGLHSFPLWGIIVIVTILSMSLLAKASNALLLVLSPAAKTEEAEDEDDGFY